MHAVDLARNRQEYDSYWSQSWRREWTYGSQTKVRRFRAALGKLNLHKGGMPLRVFDQGFGLGLMLFCLPRQTFIAGTELSEHAVSAATTRAKKKGFKAVDFRVLDSKQPVPKEWGEGFDVVISSHVLEHSADPTANLESLLKMLKYGGYAIILVPINELPGEDLNHFSYFSERSLCDLLNKKSCEIIYAENCDRLYRLIKPLAMARQRNDTRVLQTVSKAVNAVLAPMPCFVLRFWDVLLSMFGVAPTQCLVVARKSKSTS